jgi:predicted permease
MRVAGMLGGGRRDLEIAEELNAHRDMLTDEYRRSGLTEEQAHRAAARDFGPVAAAAGPYRDRRGLPTLESWAADFRLAIRSSWRSPLVFLSMVFVLGLGIGLSTALATVLHAIAWRGLPVPDPDRVLKIAPEFSGKFSRHVMGGASQFSYPELDAYRLSTHEFENLAGMTHGRATWRHDTSVRSLSAAFVTGEYFSTLRIAPAIGRVLGPADARQPVVVISHRLWTNTFGGRQDVLGTSMALDRSIYVVIGVAPEAFTGTEVVPVDVWLPLEAATALQGRADLLTETRASWLEAIGRLAVGASLETARAEAAVIATRLDASEPGRRATIGLTRASRLDPALLQSHERPALIGVGAAAAMMMTILLLICGSNAAALLLARGAGRQKEIALRVALGAGRARVAQQLIAEVVLIAGMSAVVGVLICAGSLQALAAWLPIRDLLDTLTPDRRVLGFAVAFAVAVAGLFGLAPLRQALQVDCVANLKGDTSLWGARMPAAKLRRALVATQVAISLILLVAAALLGRGVERTFSVDTGYQTRGLYTIQPDASLRRNDAPLTGGALASHVRDVLAAAPGIDAVGMAAIAPFRGAGVSSVREDAGPIVTLHFNQVDARYFQALGLTPISGRFFLSGESDVVVVNSSLARKFWGSDPAAIDRTLRVSNGGVGGVLQTLTVVGVIPTIQTSNPGVPDEPTYYLPLTTEGETSAFLVVRAHEGTPVPRLATDAVRAVDDTAVTTVDSFDERLAAMTIPTRIGAAISGLIGAMALLVAAVGIYGIVAHAVISRTRDIGVHLALGAPKVRILHLVLGWTMRGVAVGVVVGALLMTTTLLSFSKAFRTALFGLNPLDPMALVVAVGFLAAVTFAAAYLPARRALGIGPLVALRHE